MSTSSKRFAFAAGGTRFVFLCGNYVVKIPRIKLLAFLPIVVERLRRQDPLRYGTRRAGRMSLVGAFGHLLEIIFFAGFLSNSREAERWRRSRSPKLAPTFLSLPLGLLNVQLRAETDVAETLPEALNAVTAVGGAFDMCPSNFGTIDGKLAWIDYGGHLHPCDFEVTESWERARLLAGGACG